MIPPRLIGRLVLAPLVIILAVGFLLLSPFLALLALVFGLMARPRAGHMPSLRLGGLPFVGFDAEPAVGGLRVGMVRGRDGGPGHAGRFVGGERVRRPAAHRALPEPALRGDALVPGPDVPRGGADLRAAGRGRRA